MTPTETLACVLGLAQCAVGIAAWCWVCWAGDRKKWNGRAPDAANADTGRDQ